MDKWRLGSVYFAMLGAVIMGLGCLEFTTSLGITPPLGSEWLTLSPAPMKWMSVWRGIVTLLAGLLITWGSFGFLEVEGFGRSVIGIIMLWILAGCDILAMFCGSIPGTGTWLNTLRGFLKSYAPPYPAAVWLIPFSLPMIYFIMMWDMQTKSNKRRNENGYGTKRGKQKKQG